MVLFLFALLLVETLTGLYVANDIADVGPLTRIVPAAAANAIDSSHAILWENSVGGDPAHVLAIVIYAAIRDKTWCCRLSPARRCCRNP